MTLLGAVLRLAFAPAAQTGLDFYFHPTELLQGFIAAMFMLGACVGAIGGLPVAQRIGFKKVRCCIHATGSGCSVNAVTHVGIDFHVRGWHRCVKRRRRVVVSGQQRRRLLRLLSRRFHSFSLWNSCWSLEQYHPRIRHRCQLTRWMRALMTIHAA
jgi:hypothetical protein